MDKQEKEFSREEIFEDNQNQFFTKSFLAVPSATREKDNQMNFI